MLSAFASQYSMYSDVSLCSYIFLFFIVVMASLPSDGSNGVDDLLFHLNGSFDFFFIVLLLLICVLGFFLSFCCL